MKFGSLIPRLTFSDNNFIISNITGFAKPTMKGKFPAPSTYEVIDETLYGKLIVSAFVRAGFSKELSKKLSLKPHSLHGFMDNLATILLWHPTARCEMGRWAFDIDPHTLKPKKLGHIAKQMHMRYADEQNAINQHRLRRRVARAFREIMGPHFVWRKLPKETSLKFFSDAVGKAPSEYYGPAGHEGD